MSVVIKVEHLSKKFVIGHEGAEKHTSFRDVLSDGAKRLFSFSKKEASVKRYSTEDFWALKDVSFEVNQGDRIGIIGRNGAGKSTMLKILSRITEPTEGRISIKGRVASLLEVGTGFHPDLTGRENVFLNGAILGMSRQEIRAKFDEIVAFAEVERFLDTPVKRYSSGMYVRLAFAVAAHLEPEILVVDEVLAVGDAQFQKKCLGKMEDVSKNGGRTVLFVSHNMGTVKNLCNNGILMAGGKVHMTGRVDHVLNEYLKMIPQGDRPDSLELSAKRTGNQKVIFAGFRMENLNGELIDTVMTGDDVYFVFTVRIKDSHFRQFDIGFSMHDAMDDMLSVLYSSYQGVQFSRKGEGELVEVKCRINNFFFAPGVLYVKGRVEVDGIESDWLRENLGSVNVEMGDFYKTGNLGHNSTSTKILMNAEWF